MGLPVKDEWQLGPYRALSHRFGVEGVSAESVRARLEHALAPLAVGLGRTPGNARPESKVNALPVRGTFARYHIEPSSGSGPDRYRVRYGRSIVGSGSGFHAAGLVLWHVNQRAVAKDRGRHLMLHAAGAERAGVTVLIFGASGFGKTTTVASLLRSGYRYVSDEAVVLDRDTFKITAFSKALAVNADVIRHVALPASPGDPDYGDPVRHVRWWDLGGSGVAGRNGPGLMVVLRPQGGREVSAGEVRRLSPGEAAVEIVDSTFEFRDRPDANLDAATRLAATVPCYAVVRADPTTMQWAIDSLVTAARENRLDDWPDSVASPVTPGAVHEARNRPTDAVHSPLAHAPNEETTVTETYADVDPSACYSPVDVVTAVTVGTETLVHHPGTEQLHRLDPTASVIWDLLDGSVTLETLVEEVAEAYAAPIDVVRADLFGLVDRLLQDGLVADAAAVDVDRAEPDAADDAHQEQAERLGEEDADPVIVKVPPSGCYDTSARLGWVGTDAIQVGRTVLGVRSDSTATRDAVRSALSPWLVDGYDVDANLSVREPTDSAPGNPWSPAQVFAGCTRIGRHRDLAAAIEQLLAEIGWLVAHESGDVPAAPLVWARAGAVVSGREPRGAVLVPRGLASVWPPVSRDKPHVGVASGVLLDPVAGAVLLPAFTEGTQTTTSRDLAVTFDSDHARWKRVPVRGWLLPSGAQSGEGEAAADHVILALPLIRPGSSGVGGTLEGLSELLEGGLPMALNPGGLAEARQLVDRWLASDGARNRPAS